MKCHFPPFPSAALKEQKHQTRFSERSSLRAALFSLPQTNAGSWGGSPVSARPRRAWPRSRGALPVPWPPLQRGSPGLPGGEARSRPDRAPRGPPAAFASLATPVRARGVGD